jgi:radical SAM protein with 4Fe4S-binding SPASM domain
MLIEQHPMQIISWEATRRCNMKCLHCGSPAENVNLIEELNTDEVIEIFERIAHDFDMSKFRHINITGGEPFVRKDLLDILKHISQYPYYRNTDIQTNGLFIADHPDVLDSLIKYGVTGIGVSIDGLKEQHDAFRNMHGSFVKAVAAAKSSVEKGLTVTVSTVVHAKNISEMENLYQYSKKHIKPRVFRLMFIDPIGRTSIDSEYLLSKEQKMQVISFLQEKYTKECENYSNKNTMMVELGCGGWFGKELEGTFRPFIFHCIAGINNLGILYDGKIASCSNIPRDFIEGDARVDNIKNIWDTGYTRYRNREWKRKGQCADCKDWDYCHGGPMHLKNNNCTL